MKEERKAGSPRQPLLRTRSRHMEGLLASNIPHRLSTPPAQTINPALPPINRPPDNRPTFSCPLVLNQKAVMTDNVCNYQSSSQAQLMRNQTSTPLHVQRPPPPLHLHPRCSPSVTLNGAALLIGCCCCCYRRSLRRPSKRKGGWETCHYHENACQSRSDIALISLRRSTGFFSLRHWMSSALFCHGTTYESVQRAK